MWAVLEQPKAPRKVELNEEGRVGRDPRRRGGCVAPAGVRSWHSRPKAWGLSVGHQRLLRACRGQDLSPSAELGYASAGSRSCHAKIVRRAPTATSAVQAQRREADREAVRCVAPAWCRSCAGTGGPGTGCWPSSAPGEGLRSPVWRARKRACRRNGDFLVIPHTAAPPPK